MQPIAKEAGNSIVAERESSDFLSEIGDSSLVKERELPVWSNRSSGVVADDRAANAEVVSGELIASSDAGISEVADETPLLTFQRQSSDGDSFQKSSSETSSPKSPDLPLCRICLESGGKDMIAPCHCRGTQKYVHRSCLDQWRTAQEGFAFAHCTECRAAFVLRENIPPDRWWRKLKFQVFVARDHAIIFILVQLVMAALGLFVYVVYGNILQDEFGYQDQPYAFFITVVLLVVMVGILYGFFIAIICGQQITDRHYHILQKQELAHEFVVEDLEALREEQSAGVRPQHLRELRSLGLL